MRVEVGKSYVFRRDDGAPDEIVTVLREHSHNSNYVVFRADTEDLNATLDGWVPAYGRLVGRLVERATLPQCALDDEHQQAVVAVETKRPVVTLVPLLGDDPGSLERFRRVFATWDFSSFA